jgi:hypothetical protein
MKVYEFLKNEMPWVVQKDAHANLAALGDLIANRIYDPLRRVEFAVTAAKDVHAAWQAGFEPDPNMLGWALDHVERQQGTPLGPTEVWGTVLQEFDWSQGRAMP